MDVKVVGDTTYGKPVGQYGFDFCDKVLYPVAFLVTNARGQADYFERHPGGLRGADDVDHPLASAARGLARRGPVRPAHRPVQRDARRGGRGRAAPARGRRPAAARRLAPDAERLVSRGRAMIRANRTARASGQPCRRPSG